MSLCRRCEVLPPKIDGTRDYYLWFPLGHSETKVRRALDDTKVSWRQDHETDALVLRADPELFNTIGNRLMESLSSEETKDTRVLAVTPAEGPGRRDYPAVVTLKQMMVYLDSGWLLDAMERQDFTVEFAPIAFADAPDEIYAHQANVVARDAEGRSMDGLRLLQVAQEAGLLFQADRLARIAAIQAADAQAIDTPIFVNFSPASIYDPTFCLRTTVAALEATAIPKDAVCFTIIAPERWDDTRHLRTILDFYRGSGFRVALGGVGSGASSLSLIEILKPDVIFIDGSIVASIDADTYKQVIVRKLLEIAQRLRIESVVSGISTEAELTWAYEQGANYVQGPRLAAPAVQTAGGSTAAARVA
jgi:EAL domain-containing protein (putative c-di-GMP-specific phosphodiesterase class I)